MTPAAMAEKNYPTTVELKKAAMVAYIASLAPAAALGGFNAAFSAGLGGALGLSNLALLELGLARLIRPEANPDAARSLAMASFFFRLFITGGVILGFNSLGWINFPALAAGLSIPLFAMTGYFLLTRPLKD